MANMREVIPAGWLKCCDIQLAKIVVTCSAHLPFLGLSRCIWAFIGHPPSSPDRLRLA